MPLFLLGSALAASFDGKDPDVRAEAVVAATPEQVYAVLTDLKQLRAATPTTCVGSWEMGTKTVGPGATATVRYDIAAMHRPLVMTLTNAEPSWKVEFEHAGQTGFITQWTLTLEGAGTKVAMKTLIEAPPWPFKRYYFETVRPDWEWCQAETIKGIAKLAALVPVATPPAPPVVEPIPAPLPAGE